MGLVVATVEVAAALSEAVVALEVLLAAAVAVLIVVARRWRL